MRLLWRPDARLYLQHGDGHPLSEENQRAVAGSLRHAKCIEVPRVDYEKPDGGRRLLIEKLKADPKNDAAWFWMSKVVDTDDLRQEYLQEALKHNPRNQSASRALAELRGRYPSPWGQSAQAATAMSETRLAGARPERRQGKTFRDNGAYMCPQGDGANLCACTRGPGLSPGWASSPRHCTGVLERPRRRRRGGYGQIYGSVSCLLPRPPRVTTLPQLCPGYH